MQPTHPPTVDSTVTISRTLRDAAHYLVKHGWIQGDYYDTTATVFTPAACLVGAIGMVCYGGPVDAPALNHEDPGWPDFDAARTYLDDHLSRFYGMDSYEFNDAKGSTFEVVTCVLHAAAEQWDQDYQPAHVDYPHQPGTLYDCPACEAGCHCDGSRGVHCVHCVLETEWADMVLGGGA